ncbi:MAG: 50S ribosomal protein L13 [Rhabdochlamydiaceae bacterium]|nr:50S ribosomal protein L13 [Candidatus Amphrikana amoebophyrae]
MTLRRPKTTIVTKEKAREDRNWLTLNAEGKTLGRFASEVAKILMGKHKVDYTANADCGDGVIVHNGDKLILTGSKEAQKFYRYYTGHVGGQRDVPYRRMMERKPDFILYNAVRGMLPKNKRSSAQLKRLRIFVKGNTHEMQAQKPQEVSI